MNWPKIRDHLVAALVTLRRLKCRYKACLKGDVSEELAKATAFQDDVYERMLRKLGGEVKQVYVTTGQYDFLLVADAPDGDAMAKFVLAVGTQGNVRTTTCRGFTEDEFQKMVSDLP